MPYGRFAMQFGIILWRIYWSPAALALNSPTAHFSEARALQHVQKLAGEIGERQVSAAFAAKRHHLGKVALMHESVSFQVSTPALDTAAQYIKASAEQLAQQASDRHDLEVQVCMSCPVDLQTCSTFLAYSKPCWRLLQTSFQRTRGMWHSNKAAIA